jgi:hypothetical protein
MTRKSKTSTFGISFSLKRALGLSSVKQSVSRSLGIPLTKSGRDRKYGRIFLNKLVGK